MNTELIIELITEAGTYAYSKVNKYENPSAWDAIYTGVLVELTVKECIKAALLDNGKEEILTRGKEYAAASIQDHFRITINE